MPRAKKEAVSTENANEEPAIDVVKEPEVEVVAESAGESAKEGVKSADEGIAELKKRLEESEHGRERAERERNEAVQRAYQAKNETEDTNLRLIESAQAQVIESNKVLKGQYAAALQNQDFALAADIQEALALNQAKALQLENGKQSLKERPKEQPRPLDPVEAFASQLSPKSAAWVRAHPEYATNQRLTQKMIAAHNLAIADGLAPDTDDYFQSVEDVLKIAQRAPTRAVQDEDEESPFSGAASTAQARRSPAAIPVSRELSPSGNKPRTVRLSPAEVEAAELSGITPQEYYANKIALEDDRRNGRLN